MLPITVHPRLVVDCDPPPPPTGIREYAYLKGHLQEVHASFAHVWAMDGTHLRFLTGAEYAVRLRDVLGYDESYPKRSTVFAWLDREKHAYSHGKGVRVRPNIVKLMLSEQRAKSQLIRSLGSVQQDTHIFKVDWYAGLVDELELTKSEVGFGAWAVASAATRIYKAKADSDDVPWVPSLEWCYWFLHEHMKMTPRRMTGSRDPPEVFEEQQRLHERNLDRLANHLEGGLPLWAILACDELGQYYFPHDAWVWARVGARQVNHKLKADKRVYTGNLGVDATGTVTAVHLVYGGKSEKVLPPVDVRDGFPRGVFGYTESHWCNHAEKIKFVEAMYARVVDKYVTIFGWERDFAHARAKSVIFLDCWPVNLTLEFRTELRQKCPGLEIIYIPAGATGLFQVGDTDLHAPYKARYREHVKAWYMGKMESLAEKLAASAGTAMDKLDHLLKVRCVPQ